MRSERRYIRGMDEYDGKKKNEILTRTNGIGNSVFGGEMSPGHGIGLGADDQGGCHGGQGRKCALLDDLNNGFFHRDDLFDGNHVCSSHSFSQIESFGRWGSGLVTQCFLSFPQIPG